MLILNLSTFSLRAGINNNALTVTVAECQISIMSSTNFYKYVFYRPVRKIGNDDEI